MKGDFTVPRVASGHNRLLAGLPRQDYLSLIPNLEQVWLEQHQLLYERSGTIRYVIFPEQCVAAVVNDLEDGNRAEVALVGNRGFLGIDLALHGTTSTHDCLVCEPGIALRMKTDSFISEFNRGGRFQQIILDYIRYRIFMISQFIACNRRHALKQRLARMLLMMFDQAHGCSLTHDFMGHLLGAPRSEVTLASGRLRSAGIIDYQRGNIKLLDRDALQSVACECFSTVIGEFERIFPDKKKQRATLQSV